MSEAKDTIVVSSEAAAAAAEDEKSDEAKAGDESGKLKELAKTVVNAGSPVAKRMHAVFLLRQMAGKEAIEALAQGLHTKVTKSTLLSHECAYLLGQMQDALAVPFLTSTLRDTEEDCIVRHEAAEALAAIGLEESIAVLKEYCNDKSTEVAETCIIALEKIETTLAEGLSLKGNPNPIYLSVDPAPAASEKSVEVLQRNLCNSELTLFKRYKAMFALRNKGDKEAVLALAAGFAEKKSALFRHELAYVMGQLQHPASVDCLLEVLGNKEEHAMVRHEAAEALGSIGGEHVELNEKILPLLQDYLEKDADHIVRESCDVAVSITEYWNDFNSSEPTAVATAQ